MFKISTQLKHKDIDTYKRLKNSFKPKRGESENHKKVSGLDIRLGDTPENLMRSNSHRRINGKIKQTRWS